MAFSEILDELGYTPTLKYYTTINTCLETPGWLGQLSVWLLTWAQVTISGFLGFSPMGGSALTVRSLLGIPSPLPPKEASPLSLLCSVSLSKEINFKNKRVSDLSFFYVKICKYVVFTCTLIVEIYLT